jgi:MFS family permease
MSSPVAYLPVTAEDRKRTTFRNECLRAVGSGVLETAATTFVMLVAVKYFAASREMKSFATVNDKVGLLLSPLVVLGVVALRMRAAKAAAVLMAVGAVGFAIAALAPHVTTLVFGSLLGMTCAAAAIPLTTQIYQDNYPAAERGKLFSRQLTIRIAAAVGFGALAASLLDGPRLGYFPWLMAAYAGAMALSAWTLFRTPSSPLADPGREARNPFYALRFVRDDRTFRNTLIAWMCIGLANLMMQALRVDYLANHEKYHVTLNGLPLSAIWITLLTDVAPNAARLGMSPIWGRYFDRVNFFVLRIAINIGFGIAIVTFFLGDSYAGHLAGALIWGISIAGGDLCWSLWVTKLAPPHRVAHYMSVHTFLTGARGIAAPFLVFYLVDAVGLVGLAIITSILIAAACAVLVPEVLAKRPLAREVEEQLSD